MVNKKYFVTDVKFTSHLVIPARISNPYKYGLLAFIKFIFRKHSAPKLLFFTKFNNIISKLR